MEAIAKPARHQYGIPNYAGQSMTKAEFLDWESDDNYVYEFNAGILEPTTGMRQDELLMLKRLTRRFLQTETFTEDGELVAEVDIWVTEEQMRRPDVACFSASQLALITLGEKVVPSFIIEFASDTDTELKTITKRHEYFAAGVQVLWWVYPTYQEVYVYTSPKSVTICTDNDVLTAAPALPDFQLTVAELFSR